MELIARARLLGLAPPAAVKRAAILAFGVGALAGLALSVAVGPELLVVGEGQVVERWPVAARAANR